VRHSGALEPLRLRRVTESGQTGIFEVCQGYGTAGRWVACFSSGGGPCRRGRTAGLERIADLASIALEVSQDTVDNARLVMKEIIFMVAPQGHSNGSASKIFLIRRAQDARRR
jgi:hypothetical protein